MNEEPAWLRSDAVAHPRETDHEPATAERTRKIAGRRQDPGPEAEASRALAAGQPERLRPGAVLHLQRAAGNAGVARLLGDDRQPESPVKAVVGHGAGTPLDDASRDRMEASFGTDFSDVRVHTGSSAAESARAVDAHAYTVGNEVVLGDGQVPGSPAYERTLAHELTHVVQQRSGPVDGTSRDGGISVSDPDDRFERAAETTADTVVAGGRAPDGGAAGTGASIQRQEGLDEEEVQALAVQRARQDEELDEIAGSAASAQSGATEGAQEERPPVAETTQSAGAGATAESVQAGASQGGGLEEQEEEVQELAIQRQEMPDEEPEEEEVQELAIQRTRREEASSGTLVT